MTPFSMRRLGRLALALPLIIGLGGVAAAQSTTAPTAAAPTPAAPVTTVPVPAAPAPAPTSPVTQATPPAVTSSPPVATPPPSAAAPTAPVPPAAGAVTPDKQPPDTSISQTLDIPARPAVMITGKSTWDEGFKTIMDSFAKLNDALAKANIKPNAHPLAVFTETDDNGFSFSAEIPLDKAPDAGLNLGPDVKLGETPGGKAMRFQHRGSYEEIDSTYEAITAYLDEKGLEARNLFAEEYLNQVKSPDDGNLQVDIYVFLK